MAGMKMGGEQTDAQAARTAAPTPNPPRIGPPMLRTLQLAPFVDALPLPEIVRPTMKDGRRSLTVTMQEIHAKVHRDV